MNTQARRRNKSRSGILPFSITGLGENGNWRIENRRSAARVAICAHPRRVTTKRTNTAVPFNDVEGTPAGVFHGGSFGVSGTPPGARLLMAMRSLWIGKARGRASLERRWRLVVARGENGIRQYRSVG